MHAATLDETRWPATSALIDEACGLTGNGLMVAEGPTNDVRAFFVGLYYRGQRRDDLEREYLTTYHPIDNGCRASGTCRPGAWCTSPTCTRPRS